MLIATETRKASVHGTLRKPSTNRSEVVNPTSNRPPTISHIQAMTILSLDERRPVVTLASHGEAANHRQYDRTTAVPCLPRNSGVRDLCRRETPARLGGRRDGGFRRRRAGVPRVLP